MIPAWRRRCARTAATALPRLKDRPVSSPLQTHRRPPTVIEVLLRAGCPFQRGTPRNLGHPFVQMLAIADSPAGPWRQSEIHGLTQGWDWNTALTIRPYAPRTQHPQLRTLATHDFCLAAQGWLGGGADPRRHGLARLKLLRQHHLGGRGREHGAAAEPAVADGGRGPVRMGGQQRRVSRSGPRLLAFL